MRILKTKLGADIDAVKKLDLPKMNFPIFKLVLKRWRDFTFPSLLSEGNKEGLESWAELSKRFSNIWHFAISLGGKL